MAFHGSKPNTDRLMGLLGFTSQLSTCQQAFPTGVRKGHQQYLGGEESILLLQRNDTILCGTFSKLLDLHHR